MVISDLYMHADEITPAAVRGLPISRLEAELSANRESLTIFDLAAVYGRFAPVREVPEPTLAELRARIPTTSGTRKERRDRPRLTRPGGATPDEFYPLVARAYFEYSPRTRAPAREIANEAGVPVTTAHRWIREARRRGFLPPARKGKAG